jgi:nucleotide-binding universal stress UspA family protein
MKSKKILVPHDFSKVGDAALSHAITTTEIMKGEIILLHVVGKEKDVAEASEKLSKIIDDKKASGVSVNITSHVIVGHIFEDIGDFAKEHKIGIIFMGTHGAAGMQHILGSHAMKVITHSEVPFVVTQEKGIKPTGYDDIIVPLDLHSETKQKLNVVASMAEVFQSKVHLITPDATDEFLRHQVKVNIQFAKKFFAEKEIAVEAIVVPDKGFDKQVVKHAVSIEADLIAIVNLQKNSVFSGVLASNHEQYMITNEAQIPVMIVNPVTTSNSGTIIMS